MALAPIKDFERRRDTYFQTMDSQALIKDNIFVRPHLALQLLCDKHINNQGR